MEIVYCSSKSEPNTWFIFRDNGVEVKIQIIESVIKSNKELAEKEIEFINKNLK